MAIALFLKNEKTGRRYRVLKVDKPGKKIRLKGEYSEFEEDYDPANPGERFKKLGYALVKEEEDPAEDAA